MNFPMINRETLKAQMKRQRISYGQLASSLNLSKTGLFFKIEGRKGRGVIPFTEEEVQNLRSVFGDTILFPAPTAKEK